MKTCYGKCFEKSPGVSRTVAILLFDGMTLQDFMGVYTSLNPFSKEDLVIHFVADARRPVKDDTGRITINATKTFQEFDNPDVVIIPGGNSYQAQNDPRYIEWLKKAYRNAEYVYTACTGSLLLGKTGLLTGKSVSAPEFTKQELAALGIGFVDHRMSFDGKIISTGGISGGIEGGHLLTEKLAGRKMAQAMEFLQEYDPKPVYGVGSFAKAPKDVFDFAVDLFADFRSSN